LRLDQYRDIYVTGDAGLPYGSSLYGPLKLLVVDVFGGDRDTVVALYTPYTAVAVALFAGVAAALWRRRDRVQLWEEAMVAAILIIVLPQVSADYKLLHLLPPIALFLRYGGADPRRWWYLVGFAVLLVPKPYHLLHPDGTGLGVVINPLLMTIIGAAILVGVLRRTAPQPAAPTLRSLSAGSR
jgi:hypothetical protein